MEDQETWGSLSHGNNIACWPRVHSDRKYDIFVPYSNMSARRTKADPIWTQLWRRLKRGKKKRRPFHCSGPMGFAYDEYSYSQNFDPGLDWAVDPDDLSRSFSARFAVPSRIFHEDHILMV